MFTHLKINTALLICTAFVFRLLFVNIGIIPSLNTPQSNSVIKSHFATIIKKRKKQFDALNNFKSSSSLIVEICEENANEGKSFKSRSFFLIKILYSFLTNKAPSLKSNALFDFIGYKLPSGKYGTISVLRI